MLRTSYGPFIFGAVRYLHTGSRLALASVTSFAVSAVNLPSEAASKSPNSVRYRALCSLYTDYQDCDVTVTPNSVAANFSSEFILFTPQETLSVQLYDARRLEPYYALGIATTIIFGPLGLIGFLAKKRIGDVDFGFTYQDGSRKKTAFIRFKNNSVTSSFSESIKPFLLSLRPPAHSVEQN